VNIGNMEPSGWMIKSASVYNPLMSYDFLIIGGGIAGASAAYELARHGSVILAERETTPGYHATGRSAAMFLQNYGEPPVQALAVASRDFLENPPDGFAEDALLSPRAEIHIAREDQIDTLESTLADSRKGPAPLSRIGGAEACRMIPVLRPDYVADALIETDSHEIDVNALHHGFLRGLKARGGLLVSDAEVTALERHGGDWRATTPAGEWTAPVVINAAGAWADEIARLAGIAPVGLVSKRRTMVTFDPPDGVDMASWPMAADIDEQFYFKPEAGRVLASPADETPMEPCDVQPDELDIAVAIDRVLACANFDVRRISHSWAGLRSFVADRVPVVGYAPDGDGFFWLAGQGGIGIMTSPATARIAAALVMGEDLPADVAAQGVTADDLAPQRPGIGCD
jgi:D-arginine dehydrogenase